MSEQSHLFSSTYSEVYQNELYVYGSGDIWYSADSLFFHNKPLSGDGWIQAKVTAIGDTYNWAKVGVMKRESYDIRGQAVIAGVLPAYFLAAELVNYHQHSLVQKRNINVNCVSYNFVGPQCVLRTQ